MIYIRDIIKYEILEIPYQLPNDSECTVIKLDLKELKPIRLMIIFNHPHTSKKQFVEIFSQINTYLISFELETIICGDFNFDVLKRSTDTFNLFQCCKEFNLWQLMQGPTFDGKSLLHHIYVNRKNNYLVYGYFPFVISFNFCN